MRQVWAAAAAIVCVVGPASNASAQERTGGYISVLAGASQTRQGTDRLVNFDTDLNGTFTDTVFTAGGANAFSPGFCAGAAVTATPGGGCTQDKGGLVIGGRFGYDWQMGRLIIGLVGDVSKGDLLDSTSAFSTTPAFYTFSRDLDALVGYRVRVGAAAGPALVYGTAGGAMGRVTRSFTTSNGVNTFTPDEEANAWGYQAGVGVDVPMGGKWIVGVEYLFTQLNDRDRYTVRAQGPAPATNPFILVNPSGTDLRRADQFAFGSFVANIGYRF